MPCRTRAIEGCNRGLHSVGMELKWWRESTFCRAQSTHFCATDHYLAWVTGRCGACVRNGNQIVGPKCFWLAGRRAGFPTPQQLWPYSSSSLRFFLFFGCYCWWGLGILSIRALESIASHTAVSACSRNVAALALRSAELRRLH